VEITSISIPYNAYTHVQVAAGSVWATHGSISGFHKTIKIDPISNQVTILPRPWTGGYADLLVDDHSIWFSDGMMRLAGQGDLYRFDIETNRLIATVEEVGHPFGFGDGAVWAYNPGTRVINGVDIENNQVRTKLVLAAQGWRHGEFFTFGDDSIWQVAFIDDVSALRLSSGEIPPSVVRRIDPHTNKVIAEIPIGPYLTTGGISFVGGGYLGFGCAR
jgi:hypothetical protein